MLPVSFHATSTRRSTSALTPAATGGTLVGRRNMTGHGSGHVSTGSGLIASPHVRQSGERRPAAARALGAEQQVRGRDQEITHLPSITGRSPQSARPVGDCGRQRPYVRLVNLLSASNRHDSPGARNHSRLRASTA